MSNGLFDTTGLFGEYAPTRKRPKLTSPQRIYIWEHPKMYGRKCNICGQRITKLSDLELDHTRAFSRGGNKMASAHKECNRMKGVEGLRHIQTKMKFKTAKVKRSKKKSRNYYYETDLLGNRYRVKTQRNTGLFGY